MSKRPCRIRAPYVPSLTSPPTLSSHSALSTPPSSQCPEYIRHTPTWGLCTDCCLCLENSSSRTPPWLAPSVDSGLCLRVALVLRPPLTTLLNITTSPWEAALLFLLSVALLTFQHIIPFTYSRFVIYCLSLFDHRVSALEWAGNWLFTALSPAPRTVPCTQLSLNICCRDEINPLGNSTWAGRMTGNSYFPVTLTCCWRFLKWQLLRTGYF